MNTDNMSALGITIDLNVFGWMEKFDPKFTPNLIDDEMRYAYGQQKSIARWNLERVADAMTGTPFLADGDPDRHQWFQKDLPWLSVSDAKVATSSFDGQFSKCLNARYALRVGLPVSNEQREDPLIRSWLGWLQHSAADYHRAHRGLAELGSTLILHQGSVSKAANSLTRIAGASARSLPQLESVLRQLRARLQKHSGATMQSRLWQSHVRAASPMYILRTGFTRELTGRVVASVEKAHAQGAAPMHARKILAAATSRLREPFEHKEWNFNLSMSENFVDARSEGGNAFAINREVAEWLADGFTAMPDSDILQTSCGGQ